MRSKAWSRFSLSFLLAGAFLLGGMCAASIAQDCCSDNPGNTKEIRDLSVDPALEQDLLALVNRHRIDNGLQPVAMDDTLMQIAREHSQGMADQGFISHTLPSGDLKARLGRFSYPYEIARENVASAPSILQAQSALIESPGHESNLLAADVTQAGIGIARCPSPFSHQLYITQIFATPRREYPTEMVEKELVSRVDALRQNGAGTMLLDPELEKMASRSLNAINIPYKKEELQSLLSASADGLPDAGKMPLSRLRANVQLVHNPKNVSIPHYVTEGQALSYGAAIRQVTDSQNQSAFLVLTLIGMTQ